MTSTTRFTRRAFSTAALAGAASFAAPAILQAQAYPSRPVRVILPFAAGGVADVTVRLAAERLGEKLGQRFVIENMPGPGGIAAARAMVSAAPDGYTVGLLTNGSAISTAIYKQFPVDLLKGLVPISMIGTFVLVLATSAESPYKTLGELLAAARAAPGKLNIGTISVGGTQHMAAELFRTSAKVEMQHIPYKTTPDVLVGLLRNDVQLIVEFYAAMRTGIAENKLRALGTSGLARTAELPDVPPIAEAGVPGYEVLSWNGFGAPLGTPQPIIDTLNKAMREVLATPEVIKRYREVGIVAGGSAPEEVHARLAADIKKWTTVIDNAKIPRL